MTQGLRGATFLNMVSLLVLRKQIHLEVYKTASSENRKQKIAKKGIAWVRDIKTCLSRL